MKHFHRLKTDRPLPDGVLFLDAEPERRATRAEDALKRGETVVWPLEACTSAEDLRALAKRYAGKIIPFAPLLSTPRVLDLTRVVREDAAGAIGAATHRRMRGWGSKVPWACDAASLMLNDLAVLRRLLGRASRVLATRAAADGMEFYTACLAMECGALGNVVCHCEGGLEARFAFDYAGRKANLVHDGNEGLETARCGDEEILGLDEREGLKTAWEGIFACAGGKAEPLYGVDEWIEDLKTLQAVKISAGAFRPQEVA